MEIDEKVLALCREHLSSIHRGVLTGRDPRYHLHIADAADWLHQRADSAAYEVIILDLTDCGGPSTALYKSSFYALCAAALRPGGVLSLHLASPWSHTDQLRASLDQLREIFEQVTPYCVSVPLYGGQWTMALCHKTASDASPPLSGSSGNLRKTLETRLQSLAGPPLQAVDAEILYAMTCLPPYLRDYLA